MREFPLRRTMHRTSFQPDFTDVTKCNGYTLPIARARAFSHDRSMKAPCGASVWRTSAERLANGSHMLILPFPAFNPVAVEIGPFAVR